MTPFHQNSHFSSQGEFGGFFFVCVCVCVCVCMVKDTVAQEARDGIHKAIYSLISWVMEQSASTMQGFWRNLNKTYNLDSYPKLRALLAPHIACT